MYPVVDFYVVIGIFEVTKPSFHRRAEIIGFTDSKPRAIQLGKENFPKGASYVVFRKVDVSTKTPIVDTIYPENVRSR